MHCRECKNDFAMPAERCPHCAEPGIFSNVVTAEDPVNVAALDERFKKAVEEAARNGCEAILLEFADAVAQSSAVICRWIDLVERLARSDKELYASYYQQRRAEIRQPDGNEWDFLREPTDQALFGEHKEHIRHAALTLDGVGVLNYGNWSLVLRTPMIRRRASTFEENTAIFTQTRAIPMLEVAQRAHGYRASWDDRAKLCVAKLGAALRPTTKSTDFPTLLLCQGAPGQMATDQFVEVHVWGPLSIRTVEAVILKKTPGTRRLASKARLKALAEQLSAAGVAMVEV